jgi:NAD(P)-dependent dehydrogenase (short-subunit alcohol dehydrogenase family)
MSVTFEGKVALVTGAGRGIGRAVALELADSGARVGLLARSLDQLEEVAETVRVRGGVATVLIADLSRPVAVARAMAQATETLGPIEILINNAAVVQPVGPTVTASHRAWSSAFAINVDAPFRFAQAVLPSMLEAGWGRIVNVSSAIAANPGAVVGMNTYAATKSALEAHTLNLAAELMGTGITVNAFRPGSVDTAMQEWIRSQSPNVIGATLHERFQAAYEQGSLITPAHSAHSLISHLLGHATGEIWSATDE